MDRRTYWRVRLSHWLAKLLTISAVASLLSGGSLALPVARRAQDAGGDANNCVRNCQNRRACDPLARVELNLCRDNCNCAELPPPRCTCRGLSDDNCFRHGRNQPDAWCAANPDAAGNCDVSAGCFWDEITAAIIGSAATGKWLPNCVLYDRAHDPAVGPYGETAASRYDAVCEGDRVVIKGFVTAEANGEYRTAGQQSNCPEAPAQTIYKLWGSALNLYLYRTKRAWHVGPTLCSSDVFFARITTDEGADIAQSSLVADGGNPLTISCQQGYESTCGWRECIDSAVISGGVPSCVSSLVPDNSYGWMRMIWNRSVRLRSAEEPDQPDFRCLGDFDGDGRVTVIELMEVLAGFGIQSCALRADVDKDCRVSVQDVLIVLSQFGMCSAPTADRVSEFARSELLLTGFDDTAVNGIYNTHVFDRNVCASGVLIDSLDQLPFAPEGIPICMRETGQVVGCSSAMAPHNFTVYKSATGSTFLYPSRNGQYWIVGNHLCDDNIGYAFTVRSGPGSVVTSMPCEIVDEDGLCSWRACSEAQFFASSCELDCPDDAGVSREHNRNCPPLATTSKVLIAATGTHSNTLMAANDVQSVAARCTGYTLDLDDAGTPDIDEGAMTPLPSTRDDCEDRSGTWLVEMVPFVPAATGAPTMSELEALCPAEFLSCMEDSACQAEVTMALSRAVAPHLGSGSDAFQAILRCLYTEIASDGPCADELLACMASATCSRLIQSEDYLHYDSCQADNECAALTTCTLMAEFEHCMQGQCTAAEILAAVSGNVDEVSAGCAQCVGGR